jgi:glycosyltransferase involved in cell wall biosynthesis
MPPLFSGWYETHVEQMKKYDVVILAFTRWDQQSSSATLSFAKEWSKSHRVFYVDKPYSLIDLLGSSTDQGIRKRFQAIFFGRNRFTNVETGFSNFTVLTPGIIFPVNFLPSGFLYKLINRFNEFLLLRQIKRMLKKFDVQDYIYINHFFPNMLPVISDSNYKPLLNIYHSQHDIKLTKYLQRHGAIAEERIAYQADLVCASSKNLYKQFSKHSKDVHYLPNAVDFEMFNAAIDSDEKPFDLESSGSTPIILFAGYLSRIRIDYSLLIELCEAYPHFLIVVVGTYDEKDVVEFKLDQKHNLLLMGNRSHEAIPRYIKSAKVTIIPYLCNMLNKSLFPMKLNEYLALGKPVVTTDFSEDLHAYEEVITIAKSINEFIDSVGILVNEKDDVIVQQRIKRASENKWADRIGHLENVIEKKIETLRK